MLTLRIQDLFDPYGLEDPNGECPAKEVVLIRTLQVTKLVRFSGLETKTDTSGRVSSLGTLDLPR